MDTKAYRQSTIQAIKFLLSQQNDDGSFRPVEMGVATCSKALFALSVMGQVERASRLSAYLSENLLDEEGDFAGHFPRTPVTEAFYVVPNAWAIAGAQRLGHFGVSLRAVEFLGSLQHPEGGFFTAGPNATRDGEQDVLSTAVGGLALLYCGRTEEALAAGRYLTAVWEAQPAPAARLFIRTTRGHNLVTEYTEENADSIMVSAGKRDQWVHAPAMAAGFLTLLSQASEDRGLLDTAQHYLQIVDACGPDRYEGERSGLVGWGAGLLYAATGNQNFKRIAVAVADGLLNVQLANGSWLKASMGEDLESDVVDATAENLICMVQILEGLNAGE